MTVYSFSTVPIIPDFGTPRYQVYFGYAGAISCVHFPKVPFNVRQPQPKFFARCLVLVYFIYFPRVIKFSIINIQMFFGQYTINTSTIEKMTIFTSFFYLKQYLSCSALLIFHLWLLFWLLAAFLSKKVFPSHFT